jgi:DNA polymerase-3 subunit epsilon
MTGISDAMVAAAPSFETVAPYIFNLLKDRVFVAHNVNFDFSFVKYHLQQAGFHLQTPKLCTIRLSRKVFPGLRKYGLGHLSRELGIQIENRHRAGGDAMATAKILNMVLENNGGILIREMLKKENKNQLLPANLPEAYVNDLPADPGVYYFHDEKGKVIYVGKAKNIRKRVVSHFTGLDISKKRQDFLRSIYSITHTICPTEFIASLLESVEIKRLWPIYNKSQKRYEQLWGIYQFEDSRGYLRLAIDKKQKHTRPIANFAMLVDAHRMLWKLVREFELQPALCFLDQTGLKEYPDLSIYNQSVQNAVAWINEQKQSFLIRDQAGCVLVEDGKFYGMGQLLDDTDLSLIDNIKNQLVAYPENEVMRSMIRNFAERFPHKVVMLNG